MIEYPALMPYADRYEDIEGEAVRVVLELVPGGRIAGYDPLNLDNLLARAVVEEATAGRGLPNEPGAYRLPVPLRCLWRSPGGLPLPEGLPLWAATPFYPVSEGVPDVVYWHKRAQSGQFTGTKSGRFSIRPTQGRWMERRVPLPTVVADVWEAWCIGDAQEIARLLRPIAWVGKKRSIGFGEVRQWRFERGGGFWLVREGRLARSMPALALDALLPGQRFAEEPAPVGWTPPQWKGSLFEAGWWPGTPASVRELTIKR